VTIEDLAAANGLKPDSKLQLGRTLNIPAKKEGTKEVAVEPRRSEASSARRTEPVAKTSTPVKAATPAKAAATTSSSKTYTVKKGENPVAIAKRLGVSYNELLKINKITDARKVQIGQVLKVPAKKGN
jgi:LysM repeat protein